ncbi:MAG: FxLYD domain-containing protein [Clostridia bacterium]|nr:FxLYD domain-containing protein [Clostridia bacterium]
MKRKTLILIVIALFIALIIGISIFKKDVRNSETKTNYIKNKDGTKVNISENIQKEKEIDGIKIEKQSLIYSKGSSKLTSNITNLTNDVKTVRFKVFFIDEKGTTVAEALVYVGSMEPGETRQLDSETTTDVSNIVDVKYELVK